ncbi:hypothetical protein SAY86_004598 [Trapa natans]|uniref:Glycosyltransferase 61 catalytic domain-containing protein n=1 Tax=Trapa natans TaxID=22666 RepID=A0AAN7RNZ0_TRANT|nr:hypothetical protein SAY86_004598 [Trapa natans]
MNRRNSTLAKAVIFLFALNSLSLYLYFHPTRANRPPLSVNSFLQADNLSLLADDSPSLSDLKPWPILPSYLPWWTGNSTVRTHSCEAYFGNGFTQRHEILRSRGGSGWFRCFFSETLRSSVCEGGRLRMLPERIKMSRGGERLEDVMGRGEDDEFPAFNDGAFEIEGGGGGRGEFGFGTGSGRKLVDGDFLNNYVPAGGISRHTMRDLLGSIRIVGTKDFICDQWVEEPTLMVTRFEYANLFHTITDWYSGYVSSRVTGLPSRPLVIFVDGHCKSPMEETWKALFSGFSYAKSFNGSVCFRHAIFSPLGYETALFKGLSEHINCKGSGAHDLWKNPDDQKTARLSEFGEMIRAVFGFPVNRHQQEKSWPVHSVLFVRREDYLAHPRHSGKPESRLSNEQEVFDAIKEWASNHLACKINVVNGLFAHMSMKEQVQAIQDASVIIGAHGAGLTHIITATSGTVIFEIISSLYRRPHFALIAQWKGLEYNAMNLAGSHASPAKVVDKLSDIMKGLGC